MKLDLLSMYQQHQPPFSDDVLVSKEEYLSQKGLLLKSSDYDKATIGVVPLDKVTAHAQGYAHLSWGGMLRGQGLKRIDSGLTDLKKNPDYYFDDEAKKDLLFYKIGDDYLICEGKHRTVVCRFFTYFNHLAQVIHGAKIIEKQIDHGLMVLRDMVKSASELHPILDIQFYADRDDGNVLRLSKLPSYTEMAWFKREEAFVVLDTLLNPSLKSKLARKPYYNYISLLWFMKGLDRKSNQ